MIDIEDPPVRVPFRPPRRGWVCRDHHNVQVRPLSGKGCPLCPKRQDKAARRKARKAAPVDVEWSQ